MVEAKLTQIEEKGEALQRIPPRDIIHRCDCARTRCHLNKDGQSCTASGVWYTCRRQKEP